MKKILIIAYFWPYRGGSDNVLGLAKYLPEFEWQPIILTAPLHEKPDPWFRVVETYRYNSRGNIGMRVEKRFDLTSKKSYKHIKPFLSFLYKFYQEIVDYPDSERCWKPFAVNASCELFQNEDIDAMISIWPVTSHFIAKSLKARYKIPWVADFPDLWSQNHNYSYGPIRKLVDRRLELKTLLPADVLVTVSQPWAEKLKALHKRKTVYVITHGFDPVTVNIPPVKLTSKFTITYTGTIYTGKQDPSKVLVALQDLISNGTMNPNEVELRFYGHEIKWLARKIEEYGLSAIAKHYGIVPREITLKKQKESQLLLLLNWEEEEGKGCYPLKTFEYLAARRPILATGGLGDDVIKELLDETKAGTYAKEVEDIKSILKELYLEYKRNGKITYNGDMKKINKYSCREMARKFAEVLDRLTCKNRNLDFEKKQERY